MKSYERSKEKQFFDQLVPTIMLDGHVLSLGQLLYHATSNYPNNAALRWKDQSLTYTQLYNYAHRFAQKLLEKKVKPRDRVLLFFENSFEFYIAYHAITQIGAVVAPLNTFLRDRELAHIIEDSQATVLVASQALLALLQEAHVTTKIPLLTDADIALDQPAPEAPLIKPEAYLEPDEMAAILYTSGTTGLPKGVMLSSRNIFINMVQSIARLGFTGQERLLGVLPLFHSFAQMACVWASTFLGCTVIVVPRIERRLIVEGLSLKPTIVLGVPALFGLLCLLRTANFSHVKYFVSGGDALPDKIRAAFALIYNRKLCSGYGLSETSPVLTADMEDQTALTNCVGTPLIGVTLAIRDEKGTECAQGIIGVIWARGENIMLGYYNAPEKTAEVLQEGWFNTGDLGYIDPQGNLIITGREKDLIVNKGFKIYPQEVENVIMTHPLVVRVAVVAQEDEAAGQVPVAYVQIREALAGIEAELKELCTRTLAAYKVPKSFSCTVDNLPLTATGKVDKKKLQKP